MTPVSESAADYVATQLFEGLTYITADGIGPGVAETWDVSPDGKTYTFHLRKNANVLKRFGP
jgi:oligopeptide transport system substrate-binding protein